MKHWFWLPSRIGRRLEPYRVTKLPRWVNDWLMEPAPRVWTNAEEGDRWSSAVTSVGGWS